MKQIIKTIVWSIQHPVYAWTWFRHRLPYSTVKGAAILALALLAAPLLAQTHTTNYATTDTTTTVNGVATSTTNQTPISVTTVVDPVTIPVAVAGYAAVDTTT